MKRPVLSALCSVRLFILGDHVTCNMLLFLLSEFKSRSSFFVVVGIYRSAGILGQNEFFSPRVRLIVQPEPKLLCRGLGPVHICMS